MHTELDATIDDVFRLLERAREANYIGEAVSQLAHGLQAAHFATRAGADDAHILAALFHDVGHLCAENDAERMDALGVMNHEKIGAQYLYDRGFSTTVCTLVAQHVEAKRYQVFSRPHYRANLSEASVGTLAFQGGPMTALEAESFEKHPLFKSILAVRQWDEMAKVADLDVPDLPDYRPRIRAHLLAQQASG
jgi:2-amino-1-hydroxyethylphosphonate dioxygenase (glycine-forming)